MGNSVTILNRTTNQYYTVSATIESAILKAGLLGKPSYYLRVSTSQRDAEGTVIPDQIITSFSPTDNFTVPINAAIVAVMTAVEGIGFSSSSSASSASTPSSASSASSLSSSTSKSTASSASASSHSVSSSSSHLG